MFGSVAVLVGFVVILWRGIRATALIPDEFGRYLALGITTMLVAGDGLAARTMAELLL